MYREIVTKAVIGKGKIISSGEVTINCESKPSKVLGCWIINHNYSSSLENNKVLAKGKYDVHIWYGFNNDSDTLIHKQSVDYIEEFSLKMKKNEEIKDNSELVIHCVKYPTCSALVLNEDGSIGAKVEKELSLDIIGEAKLKVQITSSSDDDWIEEDIDNINVNYLNQ